MMLNLMVVEEGRKSERMIDRGGEEERDGITHVGFMIGILCLE